jgi:outer membrane protein assembly factor BamB
VVFGEYRLTSEEFEQLLDELVSSRANQRARPAEVASPATPRPAGYRVEHRGRLTSPGGKEDANRAPLNASRFDVDWAGRQSATAVVDDTLFVSNRFQVSAYRLNDGQRLWQAVPEHAAPLGAQDWPLIPMRPLIHDGYVVARMLYGSGPLLVGIERSSGQIRWTSEMGPHELVISDPVIIQQQLAALTVARQDQGANLVRLTVFDMESGRVLTAFDLLRLNDVWWRRRCCEVLVIDDSLIVTMAGVTFRCDLAGHVHWLRSETVLPPEEDPRWILQSYQRPWRRGDLVYVVQPGVFSIDCLDARTGHRAWNCVLPDLQRILGLVENRVIVQTDDRLLAFDADTGHILWDHPATGILQGGSCDSQGILFAERVASGHVGHAAGIRLVWLDAQSGAVVALAPLSELDAAAARLGPLVMWRDRIWAFSAAGGSQSEGDILELVPQDMAEPAPR